MKNKAIFVIGLFLCTLFLWGCEDESYLEYTGQDTDDIESEVSDDSDYAIPGSIYVQLTGAVASPGVYEVSPDERLFRVVEMAGGFLEDAASESINQAQTLTDGQSIHIPTTEELMQQQEQAASGVSSDGRVNINTATEAELMTLPGIGQAKARLIIDYREANGAYSAIEDIMKIQGIKEGVFNKIREDITVGV